jgi:hypothetical protein
MSDLIQLAKSVKPKKQNSILDPFLNDLKELQKQGYSLQQMRMLLAQLDIAVSRQTISEFLRRREKAVNKNPASIPPSVTPKKENAVEISDKPSGGRQHGMLIPKKREVDLSDYL